VPAIEAAVGERTKLIFVCTPNNPIGNEIREADLRRILALGAPTIIDEAYYELQAQPRTWAGLVREFPNAIVSRTFSKAYGLAGLRLGFALAEADLVRLLMRTRLPWNVNLLTLAAAQAALADEASLIERRELIRQGRAYLREQVDRLAGLKTYPSEGNFVLIDAGPLGRPARVIVDDLLARGVFIRPMAAQHLREGFVRVTVGTPAQNEHFVRVLRDYVQEVMQPSP
jgi:histidinol-phosphate aminotransferase